MRFTNDHNMETEYSTGYASVYLSGTIVKTPDQVGEAKLGVYIPKLMPAIDASQGPRDWSESITNKLVNTKNTSIGSSSINLKNYVIIPPLQMVNFSLPHYQLGERIVITMMDQDIKTLMFLPFQASDGVNNRVTDSLTFMVPARDPNNTTAPVTEQTAYLVKLDSINGVVGFHLSDAAGQSLPYSILIDQKNRKQIVITDSKRKIIVDSGQDMISLETDQGAAKIELKQNKITVTADTLEYHVTNIKYLDNSQWEFHGDQLQIHGTNLDEQIDTVRRHGNQHKFEYPQYEEEGQTRISTYTKATYNETMHYVLGKIGNSDGVYFQITSDSMPMTPLLSHVDSSGIFQGGTPMAEALAKASYVQNLFTAMAASIDTIGAINKVPPTMSAMAAIMSPMIPAQNNKGA